MLSPENIFHACVKPVVGLSKRHKMKVIKIEENDDVAREACLNVIFDMAERGDHLTGMLPLQINETDQVTFRSTTQHPPFL